MPLQPMIIAKTKGYILVIITLIFGLIQAIGTIPYGGGYLYCVMPGAILGILGFLIFIYSNKLSQKVKIGAIIAAIILVVSLILSIAQVLILNQADADLEKLDESTENITPQNWEEKREEAISGIRKLLDDFFLGIFLLVTATALIAILAVIPPFMGNDRRRFLLLIPLGLAVLAIIITSVMTHYGLSDFREVLDDFEAADTQEDFEDVASETNRLDPHEMVLGSQVGGVLNLAAIILVILFSFFITIDVDVEPPPQYYYPYPGYPPQQPPQYYQYPGYPPQPPPVAPQPIPPRYNLCPVCNNPLVYYPQGWYCSTCQKYL